MQESKHGASVNFDEKETISILNDAVKKSKEIFNRVFDFLKEGNIIISYSGYGVIPATIFFNYLRVLTQEARFELVPSTELYLNVIPYRESTFKIFYIMASLKERNQFARLASSSSVMLVPSLFLIPYIDDPVISRWINEENSIEIDARENQILYSSILASLLGIEVAKELTNRSDMRISNAKRDLESLSEGFSFISERYAEYLESIKELESSGESCDVIYTPSLEPGAIYLMYILQEKGIACRLLRGDIAIGMQDIQRRNILLSTTVEEDIAKEIMFRFKLNSNEKSIKIVFNTDPLLAQLYSVILFSFLI
ncbi:hypothetical protein IOK49_02685 [Fervidicoccus fontis]|uniref:SIS domain-containing protein n=2 Tax=Fervidicoccus fontis TaxID=683846 RepID=H9ZZS7_FERFK|nr:hypothetical protein [Fervidicoccus fontis]AFH42234.1 hypothetical protein FFONT_0243 [Fervidicoccus fontis Kam940]MBE9390985.1 hypothetical protein [Fervidicoccus fontis]PMB75365.1 MAG: hypothetical protein C0188_03380 [Fervidicoccus fontis]PMB75495.1 MAG: hypothetical protein C0188_02860 [Fervidicoccus fontis]PMB76257.1 MAG: hypothetical protein C0177_07070 [Fervidicoccus fontis]